MAKAKKTETSKKRGIGATLLWGVLGLLILVAGVGSALFYMNKGSLDEITNLKVVQDFFDKTGTGEGAPLDWLTSKEKEGVAQKDDDKGGGFFGGGETKKKSGGFFGSMLGKSHTVLPGESLWQIAKGGDLVDSPYMWRTIMVQNKDKLDFAFYSAEEGKWQVNFSEGEEFTVDDSADEPPRPPESKRYALQLASVEDAQQDRAEMIVRRLVADGYFAYIYPFEHEGMMWHRIRTGFYDSEAQAKAVGAEIQQRYTERAYFPGELWPVVVEASEQMGEELEFGVQRVAAWVVQTATRNTHRESVKVLRELRMVGNFAYIHQGREGDTFSYHIRIGYYSTKEEASALLAEQSGPLWEGARVFQIWDFEESLPGQTLRLPDVGAL